MSTSSIPGASVGAGRSPLLSNRAGESLSLDSGSQVSAMRPISEADGGQSLDGSCQLSTTQAISEVDGGQSLDGSRQLSTTLPISEVDGGQSLDESRQFGTTQLISEADGGQLLDGSRQLSTTQPISFGGYDVGERSEVGEGVRMYSVGSGTRAGARAGVEVRTEPMTATETSDWAAAARSAMPSQSAATVATVSPPRLVVGGGPLRPHAFKVGN